MRIAQNVARFFASMYVCTYLPMYLCTYVGVCVCVCVRVCVCVYVCGSHVCGQVAMFVLLRPLLLQLDEGPGTCELCKVWPLGQGKWGSKASKTLTTHGMWVVALQRRCSCHTWTLPRHKPVRSRPLWKLCILFRRARPQLSVVKIRGSPVNRAACSCHSRDLWFQLWDLPSSPFVTGRSQDCAKFAACRGTSVDLPALSSKRTVSGEWKILLDTHRYVTYRYT